MILTVNSVGKAVITTDEGAEVTEELVKSYWEYVLETLKDESAVSHQILADQTPKYEKNQIKLHCPNELTKTHLMNNCVPKIQQAYIEAGFPKLGVQIHVDGELQDRLAEEFIQKNKRLSKHLMKLKSSAISRLLKLHKENLLRLVLLNQKVSFTVNQLSPIVKFVRLLIFSKKSAML